MKKRRKAMINGTTRLETLTGIMEFVNNPQDSINKGKAIFKIACKTFNTEMSFYTGKDIVTMLNEGHNYHVYFMQYNKYSPVIISWENA